MSKMSDIEAKRIFDDVIAKAAKYDEDKKRIRAAQKKYKAKVKADPERMKHQSELNKKNQKAYRLRKKNSNIIIVTDEH